MRAVDRGGRYGVVTTWRRAVRVFDLHRGAYHEPKHSFSVGREPFGAVTRSGHWLGVMPEWDLGLGVWAAGLSNLNTGRVDTTEIHGVTQLGLGDHDHTAWVLGRDETIALMNLATRHTQIIDPHGTEVTQAVAYDARAQLLWTAGHSRILASRVMSRVRGDQRADNRYRTATVHKIALGGEDIYWLRAARDRLAYTARWMWGASDPHAALDSVRLRVHDVTPDGVTYPPRLDITAPPAAPADLSIDGRYVAIPSSPSTVEVYDLESRTKQVLHGHSDLIHFVWFTDSGGLVTADYDNRVIVWVRVGGRLQPVS